jgi:hypothetical protein
MFTDNDKDRINLKDTVADQCQLEKYESRLKEGDLTAVSRVIESGQLNIDDIVSEVKSWAMSDFLRI